MKHMMKIKSSSLEAFCIVRTTSDVTLTLLEILKTKGNIEKVINEVIPPGKLSQYK